MSTYFPKEGEIARKLSRLAGVSEAEPSGSPQAKSRT